MDKVSTLENSSCEIFESYIVLENCIKATLSLSTAFKNNMCLIQEHLTIWHFTEVFSLHTKGRGNSSIEQVGLIFSNQKTQSFIFNTTNIQLPCQYG